MRLPSGGLVRGRGLSRPLEWGGFQHIGMTSKNATNLLWVLTSFDAFDLPYTGRCLSADGAAEIPTSAAERALNERTNKAIRP